MQDFHQLKVWQKAHALVLRIYTESKKLPPSENLGLTGSLRRIAVTIARSIAEGAARDFNTEFALDLRRAEPQLRTWKICFFSAAISASFPSSFTTNSLLN